MKAFFRKEGAFLIVLFLFALGLRLIYLSQLQQDPLFDSPIMDAKYHDEWAQAIRGDWSKAILVGTSLHQGAPYFRAPLYPYFLALIYTISDHSFWLARLVQLFIGSLSCLLIYWLGKRVFNPAVGGVAAVLASIYGPFIYFEGELLIPVLIIFLDLALILAVLSAEERPGWWKWLGCGALLGLSAIARPNVLVFLVVLLPWMVVCLRRRGLHLGRSLVHFLGVLLGMALVTLPIHVHNYRMSKEFVPTIASQGGVNFFIGNNRDSDGVTAIVPGTSPSWWGGYYDAVMLAQEAEDRPLKASEVSGYWFRRGLEFMRDEPGAALRLLLKKLAIFWGGVEVSNNKDIYFFSRRTLLLGLLIWRKVLFCPFGIVAPLALAGMVLAWRRREGRGGLLALFVFSYMVSVVLFFVNARFRLPVIPFLLPFAAYSLVSLFRKRNLFQAVLTCGLILAFGLVVNLNLAGLSLLTAADSHNNLGIVYFGKKMYDQAEVEFHRALSVDAPSSQYIRAAAGLARVYAQTGREDEAIELLEKTISQWPDEKDLRFQLGLAYQAEGRLDEAIAQFQEALRLDPRHAQAYLQLGNVYEERERYQEAIAILKQAIQLYPDFFYANYNLGNLYRRLGRIDEAVMQYKKAIEIEPSFADAYNNLAWLYAQEGVNLEEGIRLINQALELDKSDGAYWDTLAELYIKKGELDRAREIFRTMIRREPEEPFWRERLREVGG